MDTYLFPPAASPYPSVPLGMIAESGEHGRVSDTFRVSENPETRQEN
jgi:hypothetical protein